MCVCAPFCLDYIPPLTASRHVSVTCARNAALAGLFRSSNVRVTYPPTHPPTLSLSTCGFGPVSNRVLGVMRVRFERRMPHREFPEHTSTVNRSCHIERRQHTRRAGLVMSHERRQHTRRAGLPLNHGQACIPERACVELKVPERCRCVVESSP